MGLVVNGLGVSDGRLDDVLVVSLDGMPKISARVAQVADGLEKVGKLGMPNTQELLKNEAS